MHAGKAIKAIIAANATAAAILTSDDEMRVFPVIKPESKPVPCLVYREIDIDPSDTKSAASDMDQVRVQVDCYAHTYAALEALSIATRNALDRAKGTYGGVTVNGIRFLSAQDGYTEGPDIFRKILEFKIRIHV